MFVSRRKTPTGRRGPRKLFTARGLVDQTTQIIETRQFGSQQQGAPQVKTVTHRQGEGKPSSSLMEVEPAATHGVVRFGNPEDNDVISCSSSSATTGANRCDEEQLSRDFSALKDLEDVLPVSCMDGLFFSTEKLGTMIKTEKNEEKSLFQL